LLLVCHGLLAFVIDGAEMRQLFLDTETTGLSAEGGDRIIEIGCLEMVNRRMTDRHWHAYINPQRPSHEDAVRIHGLTDEFLADKPVFAEIVDDFLDFVRGADLIIHNASFDVGFLNAELRRLKRGSVADYVSSVTDSLLMAREIFPGKANSLDALCRRLEVDNSGRSLHGALLDAGLLAEVYIRLTRGQDSLIQDLEEPAEPGLVMAELDLSGFTLPVLVASEHELAGHQSVLLEVDKASGGKTLWRRLEAQVPPIG
jgi:DNA polymerase-3 subunit epsilon